MLYLLFWIETRCGALDQSDARPPEKPPTRFTSNHERMTHERMCHSSWTELAFPTMVLLPESDSQRATECDVYVKGLTNGYGPARTRTRLPRDTREFKATPEGRGLNCTARKWMTKSFILD